MRKSIVLLLLMALSVSLLFGCSRGEVEIIEEPVRVIELEPEPEPEPELEPELEPEPQPEPDWTLEPEFRVIGEETSEAYEVFWINRTGYDIIEFAIKSTIDDDFPECMLGEDGAFVDREIAILFFTPPRERAEAFNESLDYLARVVLEGNREFELNVIPFEDSEAFLLLIYEEVLFLRYESLYSGEFRDTLELEREVLEAALRDDEDEEEETETPPPQPPPPPPPPPPPDPPPADPPPEQTPPEYPPEYPPADPPPEDPPPEDSSGEY